jgi:hypothetical protein
MRVPYIATTLVLCACASGGSSGASSANTPMNQSRIEYTRVDTPNGPIEIDWQRESTYDETKLLVSVDKAWSALPAAFGELGIEPGILDSKQHVFGNAGMTFRREMGRQRLSKYFDCGSTAGMSNSDTYDLLVRVISQIVPGDEGLAKLRTQAEATAHANAVSGQAVRCASTGELERRIASMVSAQALKVGN